MHEVESTGRSGAVPRWIGRLAGPALIVIAVLIVMHGFWLRPKLTNEHVDPLAFWLPRWCFVGRSLRAGHVPAWLPYQFGGTPFAADPQSGWLNAPVVVLFFTFSCTRALGLFTVLNPILAGLGLYVFFRHEGLGRPAATLGGLALAMTIANSWIALSLPFAGMLSWIGVGLAGASGYLHARSSLAMLGWMALTLFALSQAVAVHLTDGLVLTLMVLVAYMAARLISQVRSGKRTPGAAVALFAAPFLAFPFLAAAILIPPLRLLPRTSIGGGYVEMSRLATLLSGIPTAPDFHRGASLFWPAALARGAQGYVGAATLLLIPSALLSKRWRASVMAFTVVGLLAWILTLNVLVKGASVQRVARGNLLGELWLHSPYRFSFLVVLALTVLGGYGLQAWQEALPSVPRDIWRRLLTTTPVLSVFAAAPLIAGSSPSLYVFFLVGSAYSLALLALTDRWKRWAALFVPGLLAAELIAAGLVQQIAQPSEVKARSGLPHRTEDHFYPAYRAPFIDPNAYTTPGPIGRMLIGNRRHYGRYLSFGLVMAHNRRGFLPYQGPGIWPAYENGRSVLFGIDEIQGYSPVQLDPYWRLVRRASLDPVNYNAAVFQAIDPQVLELFGVKWVIMPAQMSPPPMVEPMPVASEGGWRLYRVVDAVPRASLVYTVRSVGPGRGLDEILDPGFDPATEAIVEARTGSTLGVGQRPATEQADYRELSPEHARVMVSTDRPGLLVVRNAFDQDWRATVDGKPAPVLRTDFLMQGVSVPAGRHVVDLTYHDTSISVGLAVSGAAWLALGGLAVALWYPRRRRAARTGNGPAPASSN